MHGEALAASLRSSLDALTFTNLSADEVSERLISSVAGWARAQGWRVYRRAPSVVRLPPPMQHRHSVVDVACARPSAPPVVVEVDRADRARTVEKLIAEAAAGRVPIWVRWGTGGFAAPPAEIHLVTFEVTRAAGGRFTRVVGPDLPAPRHSSPLESTTAVELPLLPD
jgi:hypothetical protein